MEIVQGQQNWKLNNAALNTYRGYAHGTGQTVPYGLANKVESLANYGITYVYTIDIQNLGGERTLQYDIYMSGFVGAVYNIRNYNTGQQEGLYDFISNSNPSHRSLTMEAPDPDDQTQNTMFKLVIPAKSHYVITISVLNGLHTAGYQNALELGR